ncbi:MAG: hypothetical protein RIC14_05675 [Filomicrobium sp.]
MATSRELKTLSAPAVFLDGIRLKVIPNSVTAELPGETKSRAVSAGGGAYDLVKGVDVEQFVCIIKMDVANTAEMKELAEDYKARANTVTTSTLKLIEDPTQLSYDRVTLDNKPELAFEAEGVISLEFSGRYLAV